MKERRFYVPYGRFDQVCRTLKREGSDLSFRQMMERAAWLRTSMAFDRELVMGNFWRTHCGWIMPDGTVQTMGKGIGNAGRLDTRGWKDIIAVDAVSDGLVGVRKDGAVLYTGNDKKMKKALSGLKNIIQIDCNGYDVYALDADGGVWKRATDFFYRHNVPAARQVVGDKNGKTAVLLADGTIGGDFARSDWTDMVWIGLSHGGINSRPLIYGLDAQGKVHISLGSAAVCGWRRRCDLCGGSP